MVGKLCQKVFDGVSKLLDRVSLCLEYSQVVRN